MNGHLARRSGVDIVMTALMVLAAVVSIVPLFLIFFHIISEGVGALHLDFFIHLPVPVGESGGGFANAIVGTLVVVGMALLIGIPVGLLSGIYLTEFGRGTKLAEIIRFAADILNGTPSIVIGIFVYTIAVLPRRQFSAGAGALALSIIMLPIILRTTETMIAMVPQSLREAGLALGVPSWKILLSVILTAARGGIVTGILLAIARAAGETAPLLFTALGNQYWSTKITEPIAALPLQIFTYAISPFDEWHHQAWAGALVLIGMVLLVSLTARWFSRGRFLRG